MRGAHIDGYWSIHKVYVIALGRSRFCNYGWMGYDHVIRGAPILSRASRVWKSVGSAHRIDGICIDAADLGDCG